MGKFSSKFFYSQLSLNQYNGRIEGYINSYSCNAALHYKNGTLQLKLMAKKVNPYKRNERLIISRTR